MATIHGRRDMNEADEQDLKSLVTHHDALLGTLSTRVGKVEQTIETGFARVADNFNKIEGLIVRQEARQGPGMGDMLKAIATGLAIVSMCAAAITMLVGYRFAPELTQLKDSADVLTMNDKARQDADREELYQLREDRKSKIENKLNELTQSIEELKGRVGWTATVHKQRGS